MNKHPVEKADSSLYKWWHEDYELIIESFILSILLYLGVFHRQKNIQ